MTAAVASRIVSALPMIGMLVRRMDREIADHGPVRIRGRTHGRARSMKTG